MKKVIITGANGFVGSALTRELVKNNILVYALDLAGNNFNLPASPLVKFVPFDLADSDAVINYIDERDLDVFYHLAWAGSAGAARADVELQLKNAKWTTDCIKVAKKLGCRKFVCAGSIMEDETVAAIAKQGNQPGLGYIYGSGKLVAHAMSMPVAAAENIDIIWTKITNAYGAGEKSPRFINTTLRKIINKEPLTFTSGTQNYDFIYIDDVARAFYLIGKNGKAYHQYLIGSSNAKPLKEFVLEIKEAVAPETEFVFGDVPFTGVDLHLSAFDCSQTEKDTGFRASVSFKEGIRKTMKWLEAESDSKV